MIAGSIQSQNRFLIAITALLVGFLVWLHIVSPGIEGGMDSYEHYLIARYSFEHPNLLLHYWGKPLYNLIASPFTQFGLSGSFVLNILCLIGASWFSLNGARNLGLRYPFMAYLFCLFSPIFLDNTLSSLTEPLNALFLAYTFALLSKRNYAWAAVIAGFLPYVRTEGFILLAVIGLFFLIKGKYKEIAILLVGSVFFNTLGWIIEDKPFWIITDNPYIKFQLTGRNICGSGPFWHYARWGHVTFGLITSVLMVIGSVIALIRAWRFRRLDHKIVLLGMFAAYFAAHSVVWGLGIMGSCGLIRVMLVIAPLGAILATMGIEEVVKGWSTRYVSIFLLFLIGNSFYAPYKYYNYKYPMQISNEQVEFSRIHEWLRSSPYKERTWAYMYPYLSILADRDPWNKKEHVELWNTSLPYMEKGTIVIWDGHFGANEGGIDKEHLLQHPDYKLLHHQQPEQAFATSNQHAFEIYVFEKLAEKSEH